MVRGEVYQRSPVAVLEAVDDRDVHRVRRQLSARQIGHHPGPRQAVVREVLQCEWRGVVRGVGRGAVDSAQDGVPGAARKSTNCSAAVGTIATSWTWTRC